MNSVERWIEQSQYDLETARAMLDSSRFLYVIFCCQQAVEKALKAIIVKQTHEFPPRIHSLIRLAEDAALELPEARAQWFRELSHYYIQTRYPPRQSRRWRRKSPRSRRARFSSKQRKPCNGSTR